ncbi:hypothetical protein KFK09_024144 [Dendrobium nobile]|uniref:Protein CYCLOPS n=1 Tax=Dendrobium nobile TaxID=94219 RepID=A0A8T3AD90_DENNO|nr:hypothetical protein KFK09_024144 [Dendrobium nobile]
MMENPIGITAPSMEMLGFKNITQSFRGDSAELFNSRLTNGEVPGHGSIVAPRTIEASRSKMEYHLNSDDNAFAHNLNVIDEHSNNLGHCSLRNAAEKGMHVSNLYLAKAWFHSSQPMTRSRSSELRRRYAAMQSSQMETIPQEPNNIPLHGTNKMQLEFTNANSFGSIQMAEMSNQMHSLMSPSNSSASFNTHQIAKPDKVSSVSMLKGTLERKKLNNRDDKEVMEGSSYGMLGSHEAVPNIRTDQGLDSHVSGSLTSFHMVSPMKVTSSGNLASVENSLEPSMESFPTLANQTQMVAASREPSQSESSTVAPAFSTGFEACDGPAHSGHTRYNGVISSRHVGNGSSDHELNVNVDRTDPTKKRRAKERNSTPPLPSDMQAVLKRFETLEKEVRSLKLNISFMNRKDSEQIKQIEELQKQNDELVNEKERLLEECVSSLILARCKILFILPITQFYSHHLRGYMAIVNTAFFD